MIHGPGHHKANLPGGEVPGWESQRYSTAQHFDSAYQNGPVYRGEGEDHFETRQHLLLRMNATYRLLNFLPQAHAKGFSFVWVRSCLWICSSRRKLLGQ
jgi:hypothetical protein